ncbi:MAG: hypothetical protein A2V79_04120 [Betaproteobacteria bacterium RBG_16_56_24]|nr:MAG: hypothetical protein A2V79_04120 [Betaproteobacteria bacterium RBG_16_56_24]
MKFDAEAESDIMHNFLHPAAIRVRHMRLILSFFCLLPIQTAVADDLFPADDAGLYYRTLAAAAPATITEDTMVMPGDPPQNLRLRNSLIIGVGATLVAVYGAQNWWQSGFGGSFDTANEGWFGSDTQYGGADKLGHLYSNYAGVRLLTPLFESAGNGRDASVSLAAWSTLGIYTAVEVVDGYSRNWKFSPQDAIANAAGALLGVVLETHPDLDEIIDFRVDYRRSPRTSSFDPFGDYSAQTYLFVVKANGFAPLREYRILRYFEAALGYGTRGYDSGERHRDAYAGLSLNLSRLLADGAYDGRMHSTAFQRGTDRLFELVQFPAIAYERRSLD